MTRKWIIVAALLVVEVGLCAAIGTIVWGSARLIDFGQFRIGGLAEDRVSVTATKEQHVSTNGPVTIDVNKGGTASYGNIKVTGGSGKEVVVTAVKTAWGADLAAAQADLANLNVVVTQMGDVVEVRVDRPDQMITVGSSRPDTVDFVIAVPTATSTYLATNYGDLQLSNTIGAAHLETDFGKVTASAIGGGDVNIRSGFGEIQLKDVKAADLNVTSNSGQITVDNSEASGSMVLHTDFGAIQINSGSAKSLAADTNSGKIGVDSFPVKTTVSLSSEFGAVTATNVAAQHYDLESNSGGISLTGATGVIKAHTDFGDVLVTAAENASFDLSTNSGSIEFGGSLGPGPHQIKSDFGKVKIALPVDTQLDFDLQTDFGGIRSDFPVELANGTGGQHWQGHIGIGGSKLSVTTNSGDISLVKLSH